MTQDISFLILVLALVIEVELMFFDPGPDVDPNLDIFSSLSKFFCLRSYCFGQARSWMALLPAGNFYRSCCGDLKWRKPETWSK